MNRHRPGRTRRRYAVRWYVEAALLWVLWLAVRRMRPESAAATGGRLFGWLGPKTRRHERIRRNLSVAFPHYGRERVEALARDIWRGFGSVVAEYPHLRSLVFAPDDPAVTVVFDEQAGRIVSARTPAVYISAHVGNWELVASVIVAAGVPLSVVYAPQKNPLLERMLQSQRRALDCEFIAKQDAVRQLVRQMRTGKSVGLLPDQRMDSGVRVPLFGEDTPSPLTPAWLAHRMQCPLIPVHAERTGNARYRIVFHRPIVPGTGNGDSEELFRTTRLVNRTFEDWIRRRPGQWVCLKRRWPESVHARADAGRAPCG